MDEAAWAEQRAAQLHAEMEAEDAEAAPSPHAASAPPTIFRGGEVTVNYFGVAKNDAYLKSTGIGIGRGPTKAAEVSFKSTLPARRARRACKSTFAGRLARAKPWLIRG